MIYTDPSGHVWKWVGDAWTTVTGFAGWYVSSYGETLNDIGAPEMIDNLNAFGPAGAELGMGLKSAGYALEYAGGAIKAYNSARAIKTSIQVVESSENVWALGWSSRGLKIDELLGNNLGRTFPTIDKLENRVITSVKSYDIANSYKKAGSWLSQLKSDINKLNRFTEASGTAADGSWQTIDASMYDSKALNVAIPDVQLTSNQISELQKAIDYAKTLGIQINTTIIK
ncbi:hypothetical protein [Paenibacillus sp. SI8]|uniref:endonuclease toxin domain-containing protein n=1 Tax=unclassified Paenibacillus TaxID=185978 RepID=UPI003465033D